MNDKIVCKGQKIEEGNTVYVAYEIQGRMHIGKFRVHSLNLDIPRYPSGTWANIRLAPVYSWDLSQIEARDNLTYLDLDPSQLDEVLRTEEEWLDFVRSPEFTV